jgi:hypothetical protein
MQAIRCRLRGESLAPLKREIESVAVFFVAVFGGGERTVPKGSLREKGAQKSYCLARLHCGNSVEKMGNAQCDSEYSKSWPLELNPFLGFMPTSREYIPFMGPSGQRKAGGGATTGFPHTGGIGKRQMHTTHLLGAGKPLQIILI